jgi:hypothetical protein
MVLGHNIVAAKFPMNALSVGTKRAEFGRRGLSDLVCEIVSQTRRK